MDTSLFSHVDVSRAVSVAGRNLTYSVPNAQGKGKYYILRNVDFVAHPGQLLAIMGKCVHHPFYLLRRSVCSSFVFLTQAPAVVERRRSLTF
jgi:hypothetical protein